LEHAEELCRAFEDGPRQSGLFEGWLDGAAARRHPRRARDAGQDRERRVTATTRAISAPRLEALGRDLALWMRAVVAGAPEFPMAGLISTRVTVFVQPRWDDPDSVTLVIHVPSSEAGRLIGKGGVIAEQILGPLARRAGARLGLRVGVEVVEA
jgi:predicted RNA-binding protein YlqC (UPF0109 family)